MSPCPMYPVAAFQFTPLREGRRVGVNVPMLCMIEFQFTPLRGGRQSAGRTARRRRCYFNSRPSARGDDAGSACGRGTAYFNSRPSARGDPPPCLVARSSAIFQFTPLREGRPCLPARPHPAAPNFNSRPSARGDISPDLLLKCLLISIHAPPRGATRRPSSRRWCWMHFNSRPSARGDDIGAPTWYNANRISIHAPPRGATVLFGTMIGLGVFQFTPLREGRRHWCPNVVQCQSYFNSRPSARGDGAFRHDDWFGSISIHAPPRGATQV